MAKSKVPVTFAFGRRDRVDPKLAPLGVLKVGKNLRVRKDGRLGTRDGYAPISMVTANGQLHAYDLHEYRGRLCANGSDASDGFPTDVYEYLGIAPYLWRGSDRFARRATLNPFTALREVAGIPQPDDGVAWFDAVSSGGYVCLAYIPVGQDRVFAIIVDAATDQVIHAENLYVEGSVTGPLFGSTGASSVRVAASGSTFYVGARYTSDNRIRSAKYTVGTSAQWAVYVTTSSSPNTITAFDMCAVTNATTARVVLAYDYGAAASLNVQVHNAAGTQVGSTITVTSTDTIFCAVEADQTDNTINLFTVETATSCRLRTFNFAGSLLLGPTTLTSGASGAICRLPAIGATAASIAVAVNMSTYDVRIATATLASHALVTVATVQNAILTTRLVNAQSAGQPQAVAFGGIVAPVLPDDDQATNALFFVTSTAAHVAFRDYVRAITHPVVSLSRDATTGDLCWAALFDPGVDDVAMPVISLVRLNSTERRQGVSYGALYYEAGAALSVYDGRFPAELGFGEAPGIVSLTASHSATYDIAASMTGDVLSGTLAKVAGRSLVFNVDDGTGSPGEVTIFFVIQYPLAAVAVLITSLSGGALTGSVVNGALKVATVATGANITLTLQTSSAADRLGLDHLIGKVFYGSNALLPSATYYYTVHFEHVLADKSVMLGPPSVGGAAGDDFARASSVTLTGNQNIVTVVVTTPHSARIAMGDALYGGDVTAVLSRTEWSSTAQSTAGIFRRCVAQRIPVGMANYGKLLTIVDHVSDADLGDNEALYTQSDRGALSGPLEQNAPQPCRYITATESRLITGGLGREFQTQVSREAFTGETISFSNFSAFLSQVAGPVVGVHSLDSVRLVFTEDRIYAITGTGPDDLGGGGFDPPVEIPTPSGLSNAWSFLEAPDGLWFQLDDSKLFRIPRGGGAPTWEGVDVEDSLLACPDIVGAAKHKRDNVAVFACCAAGGSTDVKFLVRDFRTENWFEDSPPLGSDSPPAGHGVDAITSYGDTIAYASCGVVLVQSPGDFFDIDVRFIDTQARTHPLYPFGVGGYGQIYDLLLTGEFRGDCLLECQVSYDDGLTFTALTSFDLLESDGLVPGQTIQRRWAMPQDITSSLVVEFSITQGQAAAPTEGFVFNQFDLLVEAEDGLRELNPAEMA